jgi:hypothetical protein
MGEHHLRGLFVAQFAGIFAPRARVSCIFVRFVGRIVESSEAGRHTNGAARTV